MNSCTVVGAVLTVLALCIVALGVSRLKGDTQRTKTPYYVFDKTIADHIRPHRL